MPKKTKPEQVKEIVKRFSDAQLEYLYWACRHAAFGAGWDGSVDSTKTPVLSRRRGGWRASAEPSHSYQAPEQSIVSLARRGGAREVTKATNWGTSRYWVLTEDGIIAGLAEYQRREGRDLLKVAAERRAEQKKKLDKEREIVKALAQPFRGINIRVGEGKQRRSRDLGVHIEQTFMGKGTKETVDFDRSMIEQLGKAIERIRKR